MWDADGRYPLFRFFRQPQTFPDVRLARVSPERPEPVEVALGIELKGWYLLAKEGEPSFRYKVTPAATTELDLIAVVPWFLSNVISGPPRVLQPYIESARYAADFRNYHWIHLRGAQGDATIISPPNAHPYPAKADQVSDQPAEDRGNNFGRFARSGLMDEYIAVVNRELISGIEADYWREFFKMFQEQESTARIAAVFRRMKRELEENPGVEDSAFALQLLDAISREFGLT